MKMQLFRERMNEMKYSLHRFQTESLENTCVHVMHKIFNISLKVI